MTRIFAIPGWMCQVDFTCELGMAECATIFSSEETLKRRRQCVDSCGVSEVVTMSKADYEKLLTMIKPDSGIEILDSHLGPVIWTKEEGLLEK
jgi:hypothetical protein